MKLALFNSRINIIHNVGGEGLRMEVEVRGFGIYCVSGDCIDAFSGLDLQVCFQSVSCGGILVTDRTE